MAHIHKDYYSGQGTNLTDLEAISMIAMGTDIPLGVMLWVAPVSREQTGAQLSGVSRYPTKTSGCLLPFKDGETVVPLRLDGVTPFAIADFVVGDDGMPQCAGVGVWSEVYKRFVDIDLPGYATDKDRCYYAQKNCDSVTVAKTGDVYCYIETDLQEGDVVGYRTAITDPADPLQRLGGFGNVNHATKGADFTPTKFTVTSGGVAGQRAALRIKL